MIYLHDNEVSGIGQRNRPMFTSDMREVMGGYRIFYLFILCSGFQSCYGAGSTQIEAQIETIDAQIKELQDKKRGFEARALRHQDQAERLQFENRNYLESRRHMELAEENREKANFMQMQIDKLNEQKKKLLKQSGKNSWPTGGDGEEDL